LDRFQRLMVIAYRELHDALHVKTVANYFEHIACFHRVGRHSQLRCDTGFSSHSEVEVSLASDAGGGNRVPLHNVVA
jgi:hypothetical protein